MIWLFLVEETLSFLVPKTEFSLKLVETLPSVTYIVLLYRLLPPSLSQSCVSINMISHTNNYTVYSKRSSR